MHINVEVLWTSILSWLLFQLPFRINQTTSFYSKAMDIHNSKINGRY